MCFVKGCGYGVQIVQCFNIDLVSRDCKDQICFVKVKWCEFFDLLFLYIQFFVYEICFCDIQVNMICGKFVWDFSGVE